MDYYTRCFYEVVFDGKFGNLKANEFENFFSSLMGKKYKEKFIQCKPWGRMGDRKNDGYLQSERILFQVYAPNELSSTETIKKINEDFLGALKYWEKYFDSWVFVHNSRDGLPPNVEEELLSLMQRYPQIKINIWGYDKLREILFSLEPFDICALLGPAPTMQDFVSLGYEDLKPVLTSISSRMGGTPDDDLRAVPKDKLIINGLSDSVVQLLKIGITKTSLVKEFFDAWYDAELSETISTTFHNKYLELKLLYPNDPDRIFQELQIFAGGQNISSPKHQTAVLTVLAYLFEKCTIFERTTKEVTV